MRHVKRIRQRSLGVKLAGKNLSAASFLFSHSLFLCMQQFFLFNFTPKSRNIPSSRSDGPQVAAACCVWVDYSWSGWDGQGLDPWGLPPVPAARAGIFCGLFPISHILHSDGKLAFKWNTLPLREHMEVHVTIFASRSFPDRSSMYL